MESIDKLRTELACYAWRKQHDLGVFRELVDAIEQELAERYMELPLDADGMPIHVGDEMDFICGMKVAAIGNDDNVYFFADNYLDGVYAEAGFHLHHNPDSWERIIEDAGNSDKDGSEWADYKLELVARCKALAGDE